MGPALVFGRWRGRKGLTELLSILSRVRNAAFLAEVREDLESRVLRCDLNLFNHTLDLVCIDTPSLYVYRDTETEWRQRGYSRDHRPDLPQWVLVILVNASGCPIAREILPVNRLINRPGGKSSPPGAAGFTSAGLPWWRVGA